MLALGNYGSLAFTQSLRVIVLCRFSFLDDHSARPAIHWNWNTQPPRGAKMNSSQLPDRVATMKLAKKSNTPPSGEWVRTSVSFGSVTVEVSKPPESVRQANVKAGQAALQRGKTALVKPGVKIAREKGVPLYFGCEDRPGYMVRELDGKTTVGRFAGGRFMAEKTSLVSNSKKGATGKGVNKASGRQQ